jgi:hypothetical protein
VKKASAGLVLLCVLAAGCGGGSKQLSREQYTARLATIGKKADAAQAAIGGAQKSKTVASLAAALRTYADAEDGIANDVGKLKPPDDAKQANADLAKAEHDIAKATRDAADQIAKLSTVQAGLKLLQRSTAGAAAGQEVDHALAVLKKLGYTKGS